GYKEIVPLSRSQKVRLLKPGEIPEFARAQNSVPVSYSEFALVQREYPIVFLAGQGKEGYSVAAVLGMLNGENLFNVAGTWAPNGVGAGLRAPLPVLHGGGDAGKGRAEEPPHLRREVLPGRGSGRDHVRRQRPAEREVEGHRAPAHRVRDRSREKPRDVLDPR